MFKEMEVKPEFEPINEKVRELLREKSPKADVKVRIGLNQFFGLWKWSEEKQSHMRVAVETLREYVDCIVSYAQKLNLIALNEEDLIR
jgi:hypothetical protein